MSLIDALPIDNGSSVWPTLAAPDRRSLGRVEDDGAWLRSPELRVVLDYWLEKRGGKPIPERPDIDPLELREALGWMTIADRPPEQTGFRYRLVGSLIAELTGLDLTGQPPTAMPDPAYGQFLVDRMWEAADRAGPVGSRYTVHLRNHHILFERVDMPLSAGGERVEFVLSVIMPQARSARVFAPPTDGRLSCG